MESSQILNESLSQSCCLCHIQTRTMLEQLDLSSLVTGQGLDEKISMSTRDEVLVRLGLITSCTEMNHCSKLKQVQQALLTSDIFEHLFSLLSSTDQLVTYCTSKCLEVLLQKLAKNDKDKAEGFVRQAVILHPSGEIDKNKTSSVINKTVFTLDLLANLLREESTKTDSTDKGQSTLHCMGTSTSTSAVDVSSRSITQHHDKHNTSDLNGWYHDVMKESIPELCAVFSSQFETVCNQHCVSAYHQPAISWLQSLDISSKHKICHSFLRLLYSYSKVQTMRDPHSMLSFTNVILPHLQAMLMTYCQGSVANLKMVLSVLILCVKACVKACVTEKHLGEDESDNATLQQALCASWRRLEEEIGEGEWLEKMPYHGGPVGFGGSVFASGKGSNKSSEEYIIGDRMILRKLAWLVILGLEFEAVSSGMVSSQRSRHLDQVSNFIISKLSGMSLCKEETLRQGRWIFEIFGDQDDASIGIMLSLLKINLSAKTHLAEKSCKSSNSGGTGKDEDVSDHGSQIPVKNQEKCILDAHHVFISFLDHMTWDHSILLDLLISTETDFLEYFIRYLRFVATDWEGFVRFVATDWEGFVRVQRLYREKEENNIAACQMLSSDVDTDGDDDDDDGSRSTVGSDGYDDEDGGYDVDVDKEFINADDNNSINYFAVDENDVSRSENEFTSPEHKNELHGQTKPEQTPNSSENIHLKRKHVQNEEIKKKAARKIQITEIEGHSNITIAPVDVKEGSCDELTEQEKKNELCIQSVSELGCLDDTMTILIRLRLAIERLDKKGLFPFSATPLIRLLVKVEDKYEDVNG